MRYLSVCSGIEAACRAWDQLGWEVVAFSEVERFCRAYLKATYPSVPNFGDMTGYEWWPEMQIDGLVGGTPCQAFSIAGHRESLRDQRGNLAFVFCRVADRFDPEWIVWENVPGVLTTRDNAFGCFLAELTGCNAAIDPGGIGWTDAGVVAGSKRVAAWRVIDSQGFVPQRRSRVFVVAARAGGRLHPADVLFETEAEAFRSLGARAYTGPLFPERESLRGNHPASGVEEEGAAASPDGCAGVGGAEPLVIVNAEGGRTVSLTQSNIGKQIHNQSPLLVLQPGETSLTPTVVRRLTPLECERLMGQPDNATRIKYRSKPAKDGPRYAALGNSVVVDVLLWIGQRIEGARR